MGQRVILLASLVILAGASAFAEGFVFRISAEPVAVKSAKDLDVELQADVRGQAVDFRKSLFTIRDERGKEIFKKRGAFGLDEKEPVSKGWVSAGGSPFFKTAVPDGKYSAVWTVGKRKSNTAHFTIGTDPDELFLEPLMDGFGACLNLHIFNSEGEDFDVLDALSSAEVRVDSDVFKAFPPAWAGPSALRTRTGLSFNFTPSSYIQRTLSGRHRFAVHLRGKWSNTVEAECSN